MTLTVYDGFDKPGGYTLADYEAKWSLLTLGEMAVEDTRQFDNQVFSLSATPYGPAPIPASGSKPLRRCT